MFGLGKEKKAKVFEFELEKELKDDAIQKRLMQKAESRVLEIKGILRQGTEQENFERLGLLLHGYSALLKTLSNVNINK